MTIRLTWTVEVSETYEADFTPEAIAEHLGISEADVIAMGADILVTLHGEELAADGGILPNAEEKAKYAEVTFRGNVGIGD